MWESWCVIAFLPNRFIDPLYLWISHWSAYNLLMSEVSIQTLRHCTAVRIFLYTMMSTASMIDPDTLSFNEV